MYNTWTNQWQQLKPMPTGRRYTGCGVVSLEESANAVVVVGGWGDIERERLDTVEIYSIEEQEWHTGLTSTKTN